MFFCMSFLHGRLVIGKRLSLLCGLRLGLSIVRNIGDSRISGAEPLGGFEECHRQVAISLGGEWTRLGTSLPFWTF